MEQLGSYLTDFCEILCWVFLPKSVEKNSSLVETGQKQQTLHMKAYVPL
jgi:hypothetical protein